MGDRPESEWIRQTDESWRIVSDELWQAAQRVRGRRNERHVRDEKGKIVRTAVGNGARRKRLLSGFLECGECGGSFHALSRELWGCSWHKNKGTCENAVMLDRGDLERAVLQAVRAALDEQVAEHALGVALSELRRRIGASEPAKPEEQLAAIDAKIERALDLAIELGEMGAAKERLRALRDEREQLASRSPSVRSDLPTLEEMMPAVREKLHDVETTLRAGEARGRLALGALLGEERLRVYGDGRIMGAATLAPDLRVAPRVRSDSGESRSGSCRALHSPLGAHPADAHPPRVRRG